MTLSSGVLPVPVILALAGLIRLVGVSKVGLIHIAQQTDLSVCVQLGGVGYNHILWLFLAVGGCLLQVLGRDRQSCLGSRSLPRASVARAYLDAAVCTGEVRSDICIHAFAFKIKLLIVGHIDLDIRGIHCIEALYQGIGELVGVGLVMASCPARSRSDGTERRRRCCSRPHR